ncbi:(d)CMP kinase [Emticicia fontis]
MQKITIAVDGYSSCGKSTTAKRVAKKLGYSYIDTGAMYRSVTLYFHQHLVTLTNDREVEKALENIHIEFRHNPNDGRNETFLNGLNVEDEIRKLYIANQVSEVSAIAAVRHAMVAQQRRMGKNKGVVMDGRDIGTVVFPDAELKIFMTADPIIRANRRQIELADRGDLVDLEEIIENIKKRDLIDTTRKESPLRKAEDAVEVDTSHMTLDGQVEIVCMLAQEVLSKKLKNSAS